MRARYPLPFGSRPALDLAVCAIFRDEAPYLAEWVAFHRLQGVERFRLYDNLSEDDWRSALAPEIESGIVTVTRWPARPGQFSAFSDCLRRHGDEARWIAFIDLDEFLFSPTGASLPDVLRRFERHPGVVANWRTFGPNGHSTAPPGLVLENYLKRAPDEHPVNEWVKSIVFPRMTDREVDSVHVFPHRGLSVGEDGQPMRTQRRRPPTADVLRINHYWARSLEDLERKLAVNTADRGQQRSAEEARKLLRSCDEVLDESALRFVPAVKNALATRATQARQ